MNPEQALADIEKAFELAKIESRKAKDRLEFERGRLHQELMARRESGENLTVSDIRAIEACAIEDDERVRKAYHDFIEADTKKGLAKVAYESAVRDYWDNKGRR